MACGIASPAAAQATPPANPPNGTPAVEFLPRFDFVLGINYLVSDDPRFVWDARFGGELDFIAFGRGRATFTAEYQAMLGEEFRVFDPNQGDYTLAGALSARARGVELAGVFHHVSRHLSDRPKRQAVDWNMIGARVRTGVVRGRTELGTRVDVRRVVQRSFVDYLWEVDAEAHGRVRAAARAAVIASGGVRVLGVDGSRDRGTQYGLRGEGGVRLEGRSAAVELFLGAERRIDPYQLELAAGSWVSAGFRLVSR
ncbi:MAG: hypothetical protein HYY76_03420 [Acidobacteria bacterium]|nr:hypothetical protein [Acidobacteriota bacterium]